MAELRLKPYSYIEMRLEVKRPGAETIALAKDLFSRCGIPAEGQAVFNSKDHARVLAYTRSKRLLNKVQKSYLEESRRNMRFKWKVLAREDWFDKWQIEYQIMPLGKSFVLVPVWKRKEFEKSRWRSRGAVYLDPKGAFGSGGHPTTQLMVMLMEKTAGKWNSYLDIGTGTGILSVVAGRMGAERIWAFDHDPPSIKAARYNVRENNISVERLWAGDLKHLGRIPKFGLVGANLISSVLIEYRDRIYRQVKPGGYMVISGIHVENFDVVHRRLRHPDFRCLRILKKQGWAGLLLKKRS